MKKMFKPILPKAGDSPLDIDVFGVSPEKHADFKASMLAAARLSVDDFPGNLAAVKAVLHTTAPEDVLATVAAYGLQESVEEGGRRKKMLPGIQQHDCELLQALVLTLPPGAWGTDVLLPDAVQTICDAMPKLSQAFHMQRILEAERATQDDDAAIVRSLQERIRMHTHGVRNWGYYTQVVQLSRELYGALDTAMSQHHGFSATDAIDVLAALVSEFERRQAAHWRVLFKVLKGKSPKQMVHLYYELIPHVGTAHEMVASLPPSVTREQVGGMIMAHHDLKLADCALFETSDVATFSGKAPELVSAFLAAISLKPGALLDAKPEHLFLENPVWDRPAIELNDGYLIPAPQMAFSHIHRLMDRLTTEAGLQEALKSRRASYLEQRLEALFRKAFPTAEVRAGVKWKLGDEQFENDLVVLVDRVVLIAEAKSHRLTPQGLRGAPDRVRRHIREMVFDPSVQSARLQGLIANARNGDAVAADSLRAIGIDAQAVDHIIRVSVTLDDLSVLSASEQDFKRIGWVPDDHALAPSLLVADLACIVEILDNELLLLHYLSERAHIQKSLNLLGDELDFLGLYLVSGFNLTQFSKHVGEFTPSGMSAPIDHFYESREVGLSPAKPRPKLSSYYRALIDRLTLSKPPGWTLAGIRLLSSADPAEQIAIDKNLNKLRANVKKHYGDPKHVCTLVIKPPESRKAVTMFYIFREIHRDRYRELLSQIGFQVLQQTGHGSLVAIARCEGNWARPFESVMLMSDVEVAGSPLSSDG